MRYFRHILCLVLLLMTVLTGRTQHAGFLGAVNGLTLKVNAVPSHAFNCKILDDETIVRRMKLANISYSLSYSRVLTRNIELTAGYQFAKVNFTGGHKWFDSEPVIEYDVWGFPAFNFADHASALYHGGFVAFDFYRFGSLAPVGKYIGFSLSAGATLLNDETFFVMANRVQTSPEGFFSTKYEYGFADSVYVENAFAVRSFQIKARIGRNYPVTKNLMICVGMSAPLISSYNVNGFTYLGFELNDSENFEFETSNNGADYGPDESAWRRYAAQSARRYHRIQFELALRLCL